MRRTLILLLVASCASEPDRADARDIERLLDSDNPYSLAKVVRMGEEALDPLRTILADPRAPEFRVQHAAWVLSRIRTETGSARALDAYLEALKAAPTDGHRRAMLAFAYRFRGSDGRVFAVLDRALRNLGTITPEMVASAGALTDVEALETMMRVVGRDVDSPSSPPRDLALRYIGRAARRGRREAIEFLKACTQSSNADVVEKAGAELSLLAGRLKPRSWSAWWLDHSRGTRTEWLAEAFPSVGGAPFDPSDRAHIAELVKRIPDDADAEPEMWMLEQVLGRRFGYSSPRDVFDPDVEAGRLSETNRGAIATARQWWKENVAFLFFNSATGRFDISEEGRRIGVPVDPKTGKPGR